MIGFRLALAATALAASTGAAMAVSFSQADANNDGLVTYAEAVKVFQRLREVQFKKCDPGGDGTLNAQEFPLLNNFYWIMYRQAD